ncbi:MAG TPA: amino acid deaminase, partial [Lacisediminihabitans sp.]|uniref:amino acid deaminase n=1 Tax=Lacisediminihabitans sp. TaxID=2787631 RepID=UPI002ED9680E
ACWSDSLQSVRVMETVLEDVGAGRPIDVLVELGAVGGRTGARDLATARAVAREIVASPHLRLVGVGGYEGALAHDRSPEALAAMKTYLDALVSLHEELAAAGSYGDVVPIITAGGSAFFDLVALAFSAVSGPTVKLLRSGAYQAHDDGFYRGISPFVQRETDRPFRAAIHAWVRVLSRPEPGLAIFDGGRRDLPYDDGLPRAQLVAGATDAESRRLLDGSTVIALNDQHGFLRLADAVADPAVLPVGSVLRLGLSHPCSAFDKWRLIPMTEDSDGLASRVVDFAETWF